MTSTRRRRCPGGRWRLGQLWRARRLWLAAALLGGLLTACGTAGGGSDTITIYNGQHPQTTDALVAAFERVTGIHVLVHNGEDDYSLADSVILEGSHSPADVIFTENSPPLEYLQEKGLLAHVDPATLANTPARFDSPIGDWVGVSARVSVLIYNPSLISKSQLPTSVLQLAEPQYRGKLAFAPGETDFQPIVTSVEHTDGEAATLNWLNGIKANSAGHRYADNEGISSAVNSGAVAFGVVNQYYWYRLRAEIGAGSMHSEISYFAAGDPGYVIDVSGAAVLRSSRHPAAAQRFLAFITSSAGQEIIAHSTSFEYPIASGVTTVQSEAPFNELHPNGITIEQLGDGLEAQDLLQRVELL